MKKNAFDQSGTSPPVYHALTICLTPPDEDYVLTCCGLPEDSLVGDQPFRFYKNGVWLDSCTPPVNCPACIKQLKEWGE